MASEEDMKDVTKMESENTVGEEVAQSTAKNSSSDAILRSTLDDFTSTEDLQKSVRSLSLKAQDVKTQIFAVICKEYTQFFSTVSNSFDQNGRLRDLLHDVKVIQQRFENEVNPDIQNVTTTYKELKKEYSQTVGITETLIKLCKIQEHLEEIPERIQTKDFCSAASYINSIRDHLGSMSAGTCETKVFKAVRDEYRIQRTQLLCCLEEHWDKLVKWKTPTSISWSKLESHLNSSLKITSENQKDIVDLLYAMHMTEILDIRLKTLGKKLLTYLLKPVILFPGLSPSFKKSELLLQRQAEKVKHLNAIEPIFSKIMTILTYVDSMLSQPIQESQTEMKLPTARIGSCVWQEFSDILIKECLAKAVPVIGSQLESYNQVIQATIEFESQLCKIGFLKEDCHDLLSYVKDINFHFANRKCQDLLFEARNLMTSEIHNMVKVDKLKDRALIPVQSTPEVSEKLPSNLKSLLLGLTEIPRELLGTRMFLFPECRISEPTKKIIDLAYKSLIEATESHDAVAVQLFFTVRNIFELYCHVVPTYHKENLKLPQIAALHYNNSMYLAHHCVTLGHQFRNNLPESLRQCGATFVDLIPILRRVGEQCLLEQQKIQRQRIFEILETCEGFSECSKDGKSDDIERALKQIIHQLVHLSKLWRDVLPSNIYLKCLGLLYSSCLDQIIISVMKLEFISADEATLLHSLLNVLVEKAVEVFNPKSMEEADVDMGFIVEIPSWQRYKELTNSLEASLQEIVDRWADGKGPLADAFDANEVRDLIRALFQNTDRRAKAIGKIKQVKE